MSKTIEFVPLNGNGDGYQSVPICDNNDISIDQSSKATTFFSRKIWVIGSVLLLTLIVATLLTFINSENIRKNPVLTESGALFCKTNCANSCAEYKVSII